MDTNLEKNGGELQDLNQDEPSESNKLPVKKRHCTDVVCLGSFLIVMLSWVVIGFFANHYVGFKKILFPTDSYGNLCGVDKLRDKPYLFYFNMLQCGIEFRTTLLDGCSSPMVCVNHCPNSTFALVEEEDVRKRSMMIIKNRDNSDQVMINLRSQSGQVLEQVICKYNIVPTNANIEKLVSNGDCANVYFKSEPLLHRCFPSILTLNDNQTVISDVGGKPMKLNDTIITKQILDDSWVGFKILFTVHGAIELAINDIYRCWKWIFILVTFALILVIIWVINLHFFAKIMVWTCLFCALVLTGLVFGISCYKYVYMDDNSPANESLTIVSNSVLKVRSRKLVNETNVAKVISYHFKDTLKKEIKSYYESPTFWLILTIIFGILFLIFSCLICALSGSLQMAVNLIEEASAALSCIHLHYLMPILCYLVKLFAFLYWFLLTLAIFKAAHQHYMTSNNLPCDPKTNKDCTLRRLIKRRTLFAGQIYNLFCFLWISDFADGVYYMSLAGAFATYYWTFDHVIPALTLITTSSVTLLYHTGTIAFGSVLLAIVRLFRIIISFLYERFKSLCLEKTVAYSNNNAFIVTAIHGHAFCKALSTAYGLLIANPIRTLVLNTVATFLILVTKFIIITVVGLIAYQLFSNQWSFFAVFDISSTFYPVFATLTIAYSLIKLYLNVYQVGIDTLFLCYLLDLQKNDGSVRRPYYMTKKMAQTFKP